MRPYRKWALLAPALMVLEVAMDLTQPRLMQTIVDRALPAADMGMTLRLAGIMVLAALLGLVFGVGCGIYANFAGLNFGADLRSALMRRVQSLSFADLDRLETGRLVTRLTNDVEQVQEAAMMVMRILVRAPMTMVGSLIMALITYPRLCWLIVVMSPLFLWTFMYISRRGHDLFLAVQDRLDRVNVVLRENLAGARLVRAYVREDHEEQRFGVANDDLMVRGVAAGRVTATTLPIMVFTLNMGLVAALWLGGWQVYAGEAKLGQLLAFTNYLVQMLFSLMMVGMFVVRLVQADASAERIEQVLSTIPSINDVEHVSTENGVRDRFRRAKTVPDTVFRSVPDTAVSWAAVDFGYRGAQAEPVLRGIDIDVAPGEVLAIVGATGSGKSTLANLVPRFYDVLSGAVCVGGDDVREVSQSELRGRVAIVPQVPSLFSISVADNIRFGRPEASDDEVEAAARLAQAHDFVSAMPEGYATLLEAQGTNLSGGQRQRLAIARAVLCRPEVLVLDDCTSALDAGTEARLLAALAEWDHRCTRLVIAQRLGAIRSADRVAVLEDGVVVGLGPHDQLMESCPTYRDIVWSQTNAPGDADA